MYQLFGTIARKKKTLDSLMDAILKVCKKEEIPNPKKVSYSPIIEDGIILLQDKLKESFNIPPYMLRWIALKIIDGEEKILNSIEENFSISILDNMEIQLLRIQIFKKLQENDILKENFKDKIVTSIMKRSEKICKKVCAFENNNYSRT